MDRRAFIGSLAVGAFAAPHVARAQPASRVYRIGILASSAKSADMVGPHPRDSWVDALLRGLRELGYVYGKHFVTEPRSGEGKVERFPSLAAELVRLPVDAIVAGGPALDALKQATSTIPVVMAAAADPVGQGYVRSLGRPGRNFTGLSLQLVETTAKRLELLKEIVPGAAPVAVLWDRDAGARPLSWQAAESAARQRRWAVLSLDIRDFGGEVESAFKAATGARADALLVVPTALFDQQARRITELAARSRLPAMYGLRRYVEAGGLISYSADLIQIYRRAATYVDKILKGADPGDLPVEQPPKFELLINMKAAKALGLRIPQPLLLRADEVIQ